MTIHAFSSYSAGAGSARVRLYDWFNHLELDVQGHTYIGRRDASAGTLSGNLPLVVRAEGNLRRVDVKDSTVIVSREVSPFSTGRLERKIMSSAAHSVYDFDDAIFDDVHPVRRLLGQSQKCRIAVTAANVVIAGNEYLADWASQYSGNVVMIPSCVEPDDYIEKTDWEIEGEPKLAWVGSPSTECFVADISDALLQVHRATGAKLRLVSGPKSNPALASIEHMMERIPWTPEAAAQALHTADVALGPLADTPFVQGKCAYKLLQYAASGLPIVASPIGANELAIRRFDGIAVERPHDWREALLEMLREPASRRRKRGLAASERVREFYSFDAWTPAWRAATGVIE